MPRAIAIRAIALGLTVCPLSAVVAQSICRGTTCVPGTGIVPNPSARTAAVIVNCPRAYVVDGDTIHCGRPRIRLLGIDAPEIEHCPRYRFCAPGDVHASKKSLIEALKNGRVRYLPVTVDRFGRTVAVVWAGDVNLSCWQLESGQAIYKAGWDNGGIIRRECR